MRPKPLLISILVGLSLLLAACGETPQNLTPSQDSTTAANSATPPENNKPLNQILIDTNKALESKTSIHVQGNFSNSQLSGTANLIIEPKVHAAQGVIVNTKGNSANLIVTNQMGFLQGQDFLDAQSGLIAKLVIGNSWFLVPVDQGKALLKISDISNFNYCINHQFNSASRSVTTYNNQEVIKLSNASGGYLLIPNHGNPAPVYLNANCSGFSYDIQLSYPAKDILIQEPDSYKSF